MPSEGEDISAAEIDEARRAYEEYLALNQPEEDFAPIPSPVPPPSDPSSYFEGTINNLSDLGREVYQGAKRLGEATIEDTKAELASLGRYPFQMFGSDSPYLKEAYSSAEKRLQELSQEQGFEPGSFGEALYQSVPGIVKDAALIGTGVGIPAFLATKFLRTAPRRASQIEAIDETLGQEPSPQSAALGGALSGIAQTALSLPVLQVAKAPYGSRFARAIESGFRGVYPGAIGAGVDEGINQAFTELPFEPKNIVQSGVRGGAIGGVYGTALGIPSAIRGRYTPEENFQIESNIEKIKTGLAPKLKDGVLPINKVDAPEKAPTSLVKKVTEELSTTAPKPENVKTIKQVSPVIEEPINTTKGFQKSFPTEADKATTFLNNVTQSVEKEGSFLSKPYRRFIDKLSYDTLPEFEKEITGLESAIPRRYGGKGENWLEGSNELGQKIRGYGDIVKNVRQNLSFQKTVADKVPELKPIVELGFERMRRPGEVYQEVKDLSEPFFALFPDKMGRVRDLAYGIREAAQEYFQQKKAPLPEITDELLASKGYKPDEIKVYRSLRGAYDRSADLLGEALKQRVSAVPEEYQEAFLKNVDARIDLMKKLHYVPESRFGDFYITAKDEAGKTIYNASVKKGEDAKVIAELVKRGIPAERISKGKTSKLPAEALETIGKEGEGISSDLDPTNPKFLENIADFSPEALGGHLFRAKGIPGYEKDLRSVSENYFKSLGNFVAFEETNPKYQKALGLIDPKVSPETYSYARRYWDTFTQEQKPTINALLGLGAFYTIAKAPMTAAVQMTSLATHVWPKLNYYVPETQAFKVMMETTGDAFLPRKILEKRNKPLAEAIKKAKGRGVIADDLSQDVLGISKDTSTIGKAVYSGTAEMRAADNFTKKAAFIAGWKVGKRMGVDDPYKFAEDFTDETLGVVGRANKPMINWKAGQIAKIPLFLRSWQGHSLRFARNHLSKEGRGTLARQMIAYGLLGGAVGGTIFGRDLLDGLKNLGGIDVETETRKLIEEHFPGYGEKAGRVFFRGPITELGVDISGQVGSGAYFQGLSQNAFESIGRLALGAMGGTIANLPRAKDAYKRGETLQALEIASPRFIRQGIKTDRLLSQGYLENPRGERFLKEPSAFESALIAGGATPTRYSQEMSAERAMSFAAEKAKGPDYLQNRLDKAILRGDEEEVRKILTEAAEAGKNIRAMISRSKYGILGMEDPLLGETLKAPKVARPDLEEIRKLYIGKK